MINRSIIANESILRGIKKVNSGLAVAEPPNHLYVDNQMLTGRFQSLFWRTNVEVIEITIIMILTGRFRNLKVGVLARFKLLHLLNFHLLVVNNIDDND